MAIASSRFRVMRIPIRARLSLSFGLLVGLVIISLGAYLYFEVRNDLLSAVDQGLRVRALEIQGSITRSTGSVVADRRYFGRRQSYIQIISGTHRLDESTINVQGKTMLPIKTIVAVPHSALFTRSLSSSHSSSSVRILVDRFRQPGPDGFVLVGESLTPTNQSLHELFVRYIIGCGIAVLAVFAIGWLAIRSALRPVERIRKEAAGISLKEPYGSLHVPDRDDELTRLAQTLNQMLDRIRSAGEHERRFIMFASHELRTPLTVLRTELDLALSQPRTPEELRAAIVSAGEETDRLSRLSNSLITLAAIESQPLSAQLVEQNIPALLAMACDPQTERAQSSEVTIKMRSEDFSAWCDPIQLRHAISNMVDNAIRHSPPDSVVSVTARQRAGSVQIIVEDAGPGFRADLLSRAFEPFARAEYGGGAGLGLAIVAAVAKAHGGHATATNRSSGGAQVTLQFPDRHRGNRTASPGVTVDVRPGTSLGAVP
jgi:two-component system OmpR family sensor kinase